MKAYLYILYSTKINKYYVGITTDSVYDRLEKHNTGFYKGSFSKAASDWEIKIQIEVENKDTAIKMEQYIKRMKSRKFIEKLISSEAEKLLFLEKFIF
ncbi:MAG: GIY-YIG nuclease family protein [Candidatus Methylacidiphilales bacterium]